MARDVENESTSHVMKENNVPYNGNPTYIAPPRTATDPEIRLPPRVRWVGR